jgi:hypothetical protein
VAGKSSRGHVCSQVNLRSRDEKALS